MLTFLDHSPVSGKNIGIVIIKIGTKLYSIQKKYAIGVLGIVKCLLFQLFERVLT